MAINFSKHSILILAAILILGFFLRFFMLGSNPPSLNWDEASTGYNAYSILKTAKDEYGNFLPLSIRSFDDYKPPLYTYIDVPFVAIFGLTEVAVRLPSAVLGSLTIVLMYFLFRELCFDNKDNESFIYKFRNEIPILGAFLFAISPWSLQFSRAAYEGNIGLFFLTGGLLFFLKAVNKKPWYLLVSGLFLVSSMYSYHSFRLVTPLLVIVAFLIYYQQLLKFKAITLLAGVILVILCVPIFTSFLFSGTGSGSRLAMVTVFGSSPNLDHSIKQLEIDKMQHDVLGTILHNRRLVYFFAVAKGYLDHYNPDFLFLHGDGGRQHHAADMGMMYFFELPAIFIGAILLFSRRLGKKNLLFAFFMFLAPFPSAITTGTPHPVRAIAMLPGFIFLSSLGLLYLFTTFSKMKHGFFGLSLKYITLSLFSITLVLNVTYYFHQYYVHTPIEYGDFWQYGNKDAIVYAKENEDKYKQIIISYEYDQPYVYYLFYNKIDPAWYQRNWNFTGTSEMPRFERRVGKYVFKKINWNEDSKIKNALIIGAPNEVPEDKSIKIIRFLNGEVAYRIANT